MKFQSLVAPVLALAVSAATAETERSQYGDQDLWVLSSAWQPETCQGSTANACVEPTPFMASHLTIESLVPRYNDGRFQDPLCRYTYGTFLRNNIDKAGRDDLRKYWPVLTAPNITNTWTGDISIEHPDTPEYDWTCSGLDQAPYLSAALSLAKMVGTPALIANNIGGEVTAQKLRQATKATLKCNNGSLAKVITCWAKHPKKFVPTNQIACPATVAKDTCTSDNVLIRSF
ncbi:TPA: hypothetical protein N0F65_008833 [Lagenidium giganteum]|uniref:Secreted protein n=1 Tax=Lagenidium giganteum TaxID=4803 RepID=A0AAV2YQC9_9STRA|nr:TPA: hypothetical protein N0F65_008833 [Lagenidium giganteum]